MDSFVRNIYLVVLGGLFVIAFALLLVFYSQDSSLEYDFKKTIKFNEIELSYQGINDRVYNPQTNQYENKNVSYLSHIKGNIGSVTFTNNGVFPKNFKIDDMLICLNYVDDVVPEVFQGVNLNFDNSFVKGTKMVYLDIDSSVWVKKDVIWSSNVSGFNVYLIKEESNSPFDDYNNFDFERGRFNCESIGNYLEPIAFIKIER